MFPIDVGHDRQDGREFQKGTVALVGFHHQKITVTHTGISAAHGADFAADNNGGIQTGVVQDGGNNGSGGGLAVAASNGDAVFQAHQFGQQLAARDHRNLQPPRFHQFRIALIYRGGNHQGACSLYIGRGMSGVNLRAQAGEVLRGGRQLQIGPANLIPEVKQHFGDPAHSDPADPREMQMLLVKKHLPMLLFRLLSKVSMNFFEDVGGTFRRAGMGEFTRRGRHLGQLFGFPQQR